MRGGHREPDVVPCEVVPDPLETEPEFELVDPLLELELEPDDVVPELVVPDDDVLDPDVPVLDVPVLEVPVLEDDVEVVLVPLHSVATAGAAAISTPAPAEITAAVARVARSFAFSLLRIGCSFRCERSVRVALMRSRGLSRAGGERTLCDCCDGMPRHPVDHR
ncbi:MAG: hypothetical protein CMH36_06570 [Microbacterium sp.]|uniref:Uncharacterized protein n=1 Tax=Microbacterium ginsengisoli TaxID=400772 RepID=A0A3C1KD49_9MICO|nr:MULTISPECIES: hypothetical protein [Microbacterium]MAL06474.1 hypothetical protein [Microbacterium sp.]MCK9919640.1 hypothetical protein [Microbacteriaceae bacterium K1510]HAN24294.1 hypothetical protein [Microbacterium ginsengisoli]